MTIAVSSVVKPSKLLLAAVAAMCATATAAVAMALLVWSGIPPYQSEAASAAAAGLTLFLCGLHFSRNGRTWKIDISGTGQIRLEAPAVSCAGAGACAPSASASVRLLENSTIWPNMLLLRLRKQNGEIIVLPILPDSVRADDFRALSAALRWIALRQPEERSKIL